MDTNITNEIQKIDDNNSYYITTTVVKRKMSNAQIKSMLEQKLALITTQKNAVTQDKDAVITEIQTNLDALTEE